jgi:hypothetical protein
MHNRVWAVTGAAITLLGLGGALSGCSSPAAGGTSPGDLPHMGTPSSSSGQSSSPSLGVRGGPNIPAVELNNSFSPSTLQLGVGQQFEVFVGKNVKVSGLSPAGCTAGKPVPLPDGLLSVQCRTATDYMFSVEHAGTATVTATVRPNCSAGTMCPQWVATPSLKVTISS